MRRISPVRELEIKLLPQESHDLWNSFVDSSPQGDVFCYSWWLDAVTGSRFKIYAVFENDSIVAGFPLAYDSNGRINEPPLTRTLGVLYKPQPGVSGHKQISNQRKWLEALLNHIPVRDIVQFCAHHNFTDWLPFRWKGLKQSTRYTYLIDYSNKTAEDLYGNLSRGKKSIINKAKRNGIKVEETDDIRLLYNLVSLSYKRQKLKFRLSPGDFTNLDNAIKVYGKRLILKSVDINNQVHAAIYLAFNRKSAYYLLSGSDPAYRSMGGHTLVLWEALKYFRDKVEYFNFGGSDIERLEGHIRGFGGELTPYFHIYNEELLHSNDLRFNLKAIYHSLKNIAITVLSGR